MQTKLEAQFCGAWWRASVPCGTNPHSKGGTQLKGPLAASIWGIIFALEGLGVVHQVLNSGYREGNPTQSPTHSPSHPLTHSVTHPQSPIAQSPSCSVKYP